MKVTINHSTQRSWASRIWNLQTVKHCVRVAPFLFSYARLKALQAAFLLWPSDGFGSSACHPRTAESTYSVIASCGSSISPKFPARDLALYHPASAVFLTDSRRVVVRRRHLRRHTQ